MKQRRILAILVCLVMVASMAVVASAATSKTFFTKKADGYQCVGTGNIDGSKGTATLKATALPLQQIIPGADCTSTVTVFVYDSNGDLLGTTSTNGDVDASATYTANGIVAEIECEYVFNGTHLGKYTLSVK